jgi:hypothetical protein
MSFWGGLRNVLENGRSLGLEASNAQLSLAQATAGLCPAGRVRAPAPT